MGVAGFGDAAEFAAVPGRVLVRHQAQERHHVTGMGRADPALLSPITHRSEAGQRALVRLKVRDALVRNRVNAMNSVRFLVKSLGVPVPVSVKATAFVRKFREQADAATTTLVEPLLQMLDYANAQIKQLDDELERLAHEKYPMTYRLRQVDGVRRLKTSGLDS